ncbi:MAG: acyltransferase family protein [Phycisphaerales bacterium]
MPNARRSDLDAVRSFAMLLGIALHAAMAYIGTAWMLSDEPAEPLLGIFVAGVHGFRMPLFFLLSGFFTAMLWHRRGLGGLVSQRAKRILLPLAIGCVTILPLTWWATNWAVSTQAAASAAAPAGAAEKATDLWNAAGVGDIEGVRTFGADAAKLNEPDPKLGVTALGWAAISGQIESTIVLLELGADPNARYRDGNTALHTACFFGHSEMAERLLKAGADVTVRGAAGELPADALRHDKQTTEFIANFLKVPVDFAAVSAGRERIRAMIDAGALAGGGANQKPAAADEPRSPGLLARLQSGEFFLHLWFLWFLCWLNAGFVVVAWLEPLLPSVRLPKMLFSMPMCLVWLVPLTMLPQYYMHNRGTALGFGPDTSTGIVPVPHVVLYYAVFFGFGALALRVRGLAAKLGRFWWAALPLALVILPFALLFAYQPGRAATLISDDGARRLVSNTLQVLYVWLATFGVLGLCEALFAKPWRWVRYVSDSAYWQYLVHLPLVIAGQVLLFDVEMPTLAKLAVLLVGCVGALLACYHLLVRRTIMGRMLNGRVAQTAGNDGVERRAD